MKIAIIGATSHIAKNLILELGKENELFLFARDIDRVGHFIEDHGLRLSQNALFSVYDLPGKLQEIEAIINCIGFGTPDKLKNNSSEIFRVTEYFDNLILDYLMTSPATTYINFSSGAIFGTDHNAPINNDSTFIVCPNDIRATDAYRISKLNSEAKHRTYEQYSIFDIRVFGFFSKFIDLNSSFLLSEMIKCTIDRKPFITNQNEIVRDYVHPSDLSNLVRLCMKQRTMNVGFDVYSRASIRKSEIISAFIKNFNLEVEYSTEKNTISPTGQKSCYVSRNYLAESMVGYIPMFTSLDCILSETRSLLNTN